MSVGMYKLNINRKKLTSDVSCVNERQKKITNTYMYVTEEIMVPEK